MSKTITSTIWPYGLTSKTAKRDWAEPYSPVESPREVDTTDINDRFQASQDLFLTQDETSLKPKIGVAPEKILNWKNNTLPHPRELFLKNKRKTTTKVSDTDQIKQRKKNCENHLSKSRSNCATCHLKELKAKMLKMQNVMKTSQLVKRNHEIPLNHELKETVDEESNHSRNVLLEIPQKSNNLRNIIANNKSPFGSVSVKRRKASFPFTDGEPNSDYNTSCFSNDGNIQIKWQRQNTEYDVQEMMTKYTPDRYQKSLDVDSLKKSSTQLHSSWSSYSKLSFPEHANEL